MDEPRRSTLRLLAAKKERPPGLGGKGGHKVVCSQRSEGMLAITRKIVRTYA
jgi:hypothetical protein